MDSVMISIGGEDVEVPALSFARMEEAWPVIEDLRTMPSVLDKDITDFERTKRSYARTSKMCQLIAVALKRKRPELTADEIRERLTVVESFDILAKVNELLEKTGLTKKGEAQPPIAGAKDSTVTSAA